MNPSLNHLNLGRLPHPDLGRGRAEQRGRRRRRKGSAPAIAVEGVGEDGGERGRDDVGDGRRRGDTLHGWNLSLK